MGSVGLRCARGLSIVLSVALACGASAWPTPARAEAPGARKRAPETRRQRDLMAYEAFLAKRYQESLELTAALYDDFPEPVYLRNLGRCHQRLEHPDAAIYYFSVYLNREKGLDPHQIGEIQGFIREMEALKTKQGGGALRVAADDPSPRPAPKLPVSPPTVEVAASAPTPASATTVSSETTVSSAPEPAEEEEEPGLSRGSSLGLAIGLGAVGAAAVVVGSVFGLQAKTWADASNKECDAADMNVCSPHGKALRDEALRKADISTIAFVSGGALLGAGLYFWLTAPAGTTAALSSPRTARLDPRVSADGALLLVGGEF